MRILFICGSLEPGRDGVGDYTRRLCGMLKLQGCEVAAMAYYDTHIREETRELQYSEGEELETLRLPHHWKGKKRLRIAKEWVNHIDPDWISLQFVLYAFHYKGLPFGLGAAFSELGQSRKWHVMFHELWIGMDIQSSFKDQILGKLQRKLIKNLLGSLRPTVIHTQTRLYNSMLRECGYPSNLLPLYSNIPFIPTVQNPNREIELSFTLVLFGHINLGGPVTEFAFEVAEVTRRRGVKPHLVLIGRNGIGQEEWITAFTKAGISVQVLGEKSFAEISAVLQSASVGISTTPQFLLEKSGTVAAFRLHGLPVIGVSRPWFPTHSIDASNPEAYFEFRAGVLSEFEFEQKMDTGSNTVWEVAKQLYNSLVVDEIVDDKNKSFVLGNCESIDFIS